MERESLRWRFSVEKNIQFYCKKDLTRQVSVEQSSFLYRPVVVLFLLRGQLFVVCTSLPVSNTRSRLFSVDPVTKQGKKCLVPSSQISTQPWSLALTRSHCLCHFYKSRARKHVKWGVNRFVPEYLRKVFHLLLWEGRISKRKIMSFESCYPTQKKTSQHL